MWVYDVTIKGKAVRFYSLTLSSWRLYIPAETIQSNLLVIIVKLKDFAYAFQCFHVLTVILIYVFSLGISSVTSEVM